MSNLSGHGQLTGVMRTGGGGSTTDYNELTNKPKINNVELSGNKTTSDLNISYEDLINKPTIRNVPDATGAELGSVLTHTASGEGWFPVPKELPPAASGDDGDVLTLVDGSPEWVPAGGGSSIEYSTTEHIIGTWVDGSDVYEKAINYINSTPHGDSPFNVNIIENVNEIIECSLMYSDSGLQNGRYNPLNDDTAQVNFDMYSHRLYKDSNTLFGYFAGSSGALKIVGVVRYTKVGE